MVFFIIAAALLLIFYISGNNKSNNALKLPEAPRVFKKPEKLLEENFGYFKSLSLPEKKEFLARIRTIINSKSFIGKEGFIITHPVKVLISGALVQLTFGLKNFQVPNYHSVFIYPDAYVNHHTNRLYKGETNTLGYISLSWKHFREGYRVPDDRLNVGLHEMAHALLNTIIFSDDHDSGLDQKLINLDHIPSEERNRLFAGDHPFFRNYATTNIKEFFAVSVECFFEDPRRFTGEFPVFYTLLCKLLNQDPALKITRLNKVD